MNEVDLRPPWDRLTWNCRQKFGVPNWSVRERETPPKRSSQTSRLLISERGFVPISRNTPESSGYLESHSFILDFGSFGAWTRKRFYIFPLESEITNHDNTLLTFRAFRSFLSYLILPERSSFVFIKSETREPNKLSNLRNSDSSLFLSVIAIESLRRRRRQNDSRIDSKAVLRTPVQH